MRPNRLASSPEAARALTGPWIGLFPMTYAAHIAEEALCGVTFPVWVSRLWGIEFTREEFLALNAVAFTIMCLGVLWIRLSTTGHLILVALAFVVTFNGLAHIVASGLTWSYSPGAITGLLLWIPLGVGTLGRCRRALSRLDLNLGITIGIGLHALVSWFAFRAGS